MQEAGKSVFLVFAPVIIFYIKSMLETLFFCGNFFNNYVYIDMYG